MPRSLKRGGFSTCHWPIENRPQDEILPHRPIGLEVTA